MLSSHPTKPCKFCGQTNHFPYQCRLNPKKKKYLKSQGKTAKQWKVTRDTWIKKNPPSHEGYWECYLKIHPNCPRWLDIYSLTLDHVVPRSKDGSIKFSQSNLKPACSWCNEMKGSRKLDEVL